MKRSASELTVSVHTEMQTAVFCMCNYTQCTRHCTDCAILHCTVNTTVYTHANTVLYVNTL